MRLKKETFRIQTAEYIRSLIRSGELPPGSPVRESFLAARLGISRAPIREALSSLAQQGLIHDIPQKGKFVRRMSAHEIYDCYTVAGILEGAGAAESLRYWTPRDRKALQDIVARMAARINHPALLDGLTEIGDQFHAVLLSVCPNVHLVELARSTCALISQYLYHQYWTSLFTPREFYERHLSIAEAVHKGDPVRLEQVVRGHYRENGIRMSTIIHNDPAPRMSAGR